MFMYVSVSVRARVPVRAHACFQRWVKWTTLRPLTIFLATLFEEGERVEGDRGFIRCENCLYSFLDVSVLFLRIIYEDALLFIILEIELVVLCRRLRPPVPVSMFTFLCMLCSFSCIFDLHCCIRQQKIHKIVLAVTQFA